MLDPERRAPQTMILRFRDLSVAAGHTIKEHSEIIAAKGGVWWGWWKKQGEKVPVATFQALAKQDALPREVFLFDTGSSSLYRATLLDIHWSAKGEFIPTPDADRTPAYYGNVSYLAWFRFGTIEPVPDGEQLLRGYSYCRVDEFFETNRSIFQDFYGKQISSFVELTHQERTIWFIGPKQAGDPSHEIRLYDSARTTPADFPQNVIASASSLLVWVSDLHFSAGRHGFPLVSDEHGWDLSRVLREDLQEFCGAKEMAGMLLSGDLTWAAQENEFQLARSFIDGIRSWATLQYHNFVVCPGNHDVAFATDPSAKNLPVTAAPETALKNFRSFYEGLYSTKGNKWLCSGRRFLVGNARAVEVVSLNSSFLTQVEDLFQGQGFLGEDQLGFAAEQMGWKKHSDGPRAFRIVMLHHHVVPIIHRELPVYEHRASTVYDAGALCKWLTEHEVDLVIHGHMHQAGIVKESRSPNLRATPEAWHEFTIAALGSTGVKVDHTSDRRNSYAVLDFRRQSVKLTIRQISAVNDIGSGEKTIAEVELPYR